MVDRGSLPPSSRSRDVAGEDFLFHLYRGSELLQDNRVHDAKAEIEQALSLQPSDPKGQDLLGVVYFRLGLYPRAIAIYEELIRSHPDAIEPRINLALSYLKTGQPSQARFELEKVVEQSPGHSRAWGYLGLAFQRLGDYERASYAFTAGGHDGMARRLMDMAVSGSSAPGPSEFAPMAENEGAGDLNFAAANDAGTEASSGVPSPGAPPSRGDAGAASVRMLAQPANAEAARQASFRPTAPPSFRPSLPPLAHASTPPPEPAPAVAIRPTTTRPRRLVDFGRESLLVFPRDHAVSLHAGGLVLVHVATGFSTRLEAVRAMVHTGDGETTALQRRVRGRALDEPLGGPTSPIVEIVGKGELILGPSPGRRLVPILLEADTFYLREDSLIGFEPSVSYENGRLPLGDGDGLPMVLLRGPGSVVVSLTESTASLEVVDGRRAIVRTLSVLGWLGHVVPHAVPAAESPGGMRGLTAFVGEGMVLVDGR